MKYEVTLDAYLSKLGERNVLLKHGVKTLKDELEKYSLVAIVIGSSVSSANYKDIDIPVFGEECDFTLFVENIRAALGTLRAQGADLIKDVDLVDHGNKEYAETYGRLFEFGFFDMLYSTEFKACQVGEFIDRLKTADIPLVLHQWNSACSKTAHDVRNVMPPVCLEMPSISGIPEKQGFS